MTQPPNSATRSDFIYIRAFALAAKHLLDADDLDGDTDYSDVVKDLVDLPVLREMLEVMEGHLKTQVEEVGVNLGQLETSLRNLKIDLSAVSNLLERLPKDDNPL
jgi:hypothetical protein